MTDLSGEPPQPDHHSPLPQEGVLGQSQTLGVGILREEFPSVTDPIPPHCWLGYLVPEVCLRAEFPLLEHLGELVQATVVEVKDLVLALSAGHHQLATGASLVTEEGPWGGGGVNALTQVLISEFNQSPLSATSGRKQPVPRESGSLCGEQSQQNSVPPLPRKQSSCIQRTPGTPTISELSWRPGGVC